MSSARWGWGPDLSQEPWMNQPDHSRPICGDGTHKFFLQPFKSFSFPFSPPDSGFSRVAVAEGASLELAVKQSPNTGPAHFTQDTLSRKKEQPWPRKHATYLVRRTGLHRSGILGSLTWCVPPTTSVRHRGLVHCSFTAVTFSAVLGSRSVEKQNPSQNHSKFTY